jgi:hypothetical protein
MSSRRHVHGLAGNVTATAARPAQTLKAREAGGATDPAPTTATPPLPHHVRAVFEQDATCRAGTVNCRVTSVPMSTDLIKLP